MFKYGDTVYVWDDDKAYGEFRAFVVDRGEKYASRYGAMERMCVDDEFSDLIFYNNCSNVIEMTKAQIAEKLGAPVLIIDEEED